MNHLQDNMGHRNETNPEFEYQTTSGPRGSWNGRGLPPSGSGWESNVYRGRNGYCLFEHTEESYWMRRRDQSNVFKFNPSAESPDTKVQMLVVMLVHGTESQQMKALSEIGRTVCQK